MSLHNFPRVTLAQAAQRPNLDFVLPGLLAGSVGMIAGNGAVGKSILALHISQAIATGKPVASGLWPAPRTGPVLVIAGEDGPAILQERLHWLRQSMTESGIAMFDELVEIRSGAGEDMRILTRDGGPGPFLPLLEEAAAGQRLVILDPLAFLHDADEQDNGAMTRLMQLCQGVCKRTGTTIILLHHFSKAGHQAGGEDWSAARGASSLTTAVRWQVNLTPPTNQERKEYGIDDAMAGHWVKVATVKVNYGERGKEGWLHRAKGGVLEHVQHMLKTRKPTHSDNDKAARVAAAWGAEMVDDPDAL